MVASWRTLALAIAFTLLPAVVHAEAPWSQGVTEEQKAKLAWESKLGRWTEMFDRHNPKEKAYNRRLPFLVEGFLPLTYTVLLASESKEGKTAFLDALSLAVVKGEDFAGRKTTKGAVLWCAYEEHKKQRELNLTLDPQYNESELDTYTTFSGRGNKPSRDYISWAVFLLLRLGGRGHKPSRDYIGVASVRPAAR